MVARGPLASLWMTVLLLLFAGVPGLLPHTSWGGGWGMELEARCPRPSHPWFGTGM